MHFHLPKPLHGWREFAGEVGIILLGVLLALLGQAMFEEWTWDRKVEAATSAMDDEIKRALAARSKQIERLSAVVRNWISSRAS